MRYDDLGDLLDLFEGYNAYVHVPTDNLEDGLLLFPTPDYFDPATAPLIDFLGQRVWWRPNHCDPIPLDEMDTDHIQNLFRFLNRNARNVVAKIENDLWNMSFGLTGEMAIDSIDRAISQYEEVDVRYSVLYREVAARVLAIRMRTARNMTTELF